MSSLGHTFAHILAAMAAAGLVLVPAAASASEGGGGGGGRFQLEYDENFYDAVDEDEDEAPIGFSVKYSTTRGFVFGAEFDSGLTYDVTRIETVKEPEIELYGPRLSDDKFNYLTPRFSYRFPSLYTAPVQSNSGGASPGVGSSFRFQTWASERAVERFSVEATYGQTEENAEDQTQTDRVANFYGTTQEEAEKMSRSFGELAAHFRAQGYLGSEAYNKLQAQFGPRPDATSGQALGAGASTSWSAANGVGSATDLSGWQGAYLYCGGTCVPSAN